MDVIEAIESRRSVRGFLADPVPQATVSDILRVAARAPSGTNMQPWKVVVVAGAEKAALTEAVRAAMDSGTPTQREYKYYPDTFPPEYAARRREIGWALYGLIGIEKGDREGSRRQQMRNYDFYGAPVGLFFFIDRVLEIGSWLDYGMFIENVMIAARAHGLHTCPQVAWCNQHALVRERLGVSEDQALVCGMSLGHEDPGHATAKLQTPRVPVDEFTRFEGF
ncbi:MAG: nitroreductase [Alphaproteobacteria bacterium]